MSQKYIDFDQYREEKKGDKLVIKAYGEELELPASPRLSVMESLIELKNSKSTGHELEEEKIIFMLKQLLGEEQARKLFDSGLTAKESEWLIKQIWEMYNPERGNDTKNPPSSTSQANGEPSKQTSEENTE